VRVVIATFDDLASMGPTAEELSRGPNRTARFMRDRTGCSQLHRAIDELIGARQTFDDRIDAQER